MTEQTGDGNVYHELFADGKYDRKSTSSSVARTQDHFLAKTGMKMRILVLVLQIQLQEKK